MCYSNNLQNKKNLKMNNTNFINNKNTNNKLNYKNENNN